MKNLNRRIANLRPLELTPLFKVSPALTGDLAPARHRDRLATHRSLRSVLVPLDGSLAAEHALPHALAFARRTGATVRIIHVYSHLAHVAPWQMSLSHETMERQKGVQREYLQGVAERIARTSDVSLTTALIDSPYIEATLCEAAMGSDLLIMASSRRGFLTRLWPNSVLEQLRQQLRSPLLLVRGYPYPVDLTGDPIPRNILAPLDGSPFAESVISPATMIGGLNDAALTLLNVQDQVWTSDSFNHAAPESYLDSIARCARQVLSTVHTQILTANGPIGAAVARYAAQHLMDLIAIATHHDDGVVRLLRGSVADAIIRQTNVPILLMRADIDSGSGALAVVG